MSYLNDEYHPPSSNEIEVSIFGPGIGECVVVHLGDANWMIVDSCISRETRRPIAIEYLEKLGINPADAVKLFVITHWHDDHIKGAYDIFKQCSSSTFSLAAVFTKSEFKDFVELNRNQPENIGSDTDEFGKIFDHLCNRALPHHLSFAFESKRLYNQSHATLNYSIEVWSLSPSSNAMLLFLDEIRNKIKPRRLRTRPIEQSPNDISVALLVRLGNIDILLGGDLSMGKDRTLGWQAVVSSQGLPIVNADIFKVPHHGSITSHCPEVWNKMVSKGSVALLSQYASGKRSLPSEEDIYRIRGYTDKIYCTGPPTGWKPDKTKTRLAAKFASSLGTWRRVEGQMGHVRTRITTENSPPIIDTKLYGNAYSF